MARRFIVSKHTNKVSLERNAGVLGDNRAAVGGQCPSCCQRASGAVCPGRRQTRLSWLKSQEHLALDGSHAIALDLRGHGDSEWAPSGGYRIEELADDLIIVVDQLATRPALVGAALGGLSALIAEGKIGPRSFASFTLVDIAPNMEAAGVARVMDFISAHVEAGLASPEEAGAVVDTYWPREGKRTIAAPLVPYLRKSTDGRWRGIGIRASFPWSWRATAMAASTNSTKRPDVCHAQSTSSLAAPAT